MEFYIDMIVAVCYKRSDPHIPELKHDLEVGMGYEVYNIVVGSSRTLVYLKDGRKYNAIFFQFFEDGKEIDIYTDKRFNPYLK